MTMKPRRAKATPMAPGFQAVVIVEVLLGAFVAGVLGAVLIWG